MSDPSIQPHLDLSTAVDHDPQESAEWRDALASVLRAAGPARVRELMDMLARAWRAIRPSAGSPRRARPMSTPSPPRAAAVPRRPGDRGAAGVADALECAWRWWCAPTRPMANSAATSPVMPARPICSRSASTISSAPPTPCRRRPGVLPAALGARRVCARVSRRAPERARPRALPAGDQARRRGAQGL